MASASLPAVAEKSRFWYLYGKNLCYLANKRIKFNSFHENCWGCEHNGRLLKKTTIFVAFGAAENAMFKFFLQKAG
jgi:hypothetical protein